jgi:hypothetical protein
MGGGKDSGSKKALRAQQQATKDAIGEQRRQFDFVAGLMQPFVDAGTGALGGYEDILGLNGDEAQQLAYQAITAGPEFQQLQQVGNTNILQNASATGGLRGGNTQLALGELSPGILNQLVQQRLGNLGNLTQWGLQGAGGLGNTAVQTGNSIANLISGQGNATAGYYQNQQNQSNQLFNNALSLGGFVFGSGGLF